LTEQIGGVRTEIASVRTDLTQQIADVKTELSNQIENQTARIDLLDSRVYDLALTVGGLRNDLANNQVNHPRHRARLSSQHATPSAA